MHSPTRPASRLFAVRHLDGVATADASKRSLAQVPRMNPSQSPTAGASSEFLAIAPTFHNILYVHPNFGGLSPWAATSSPLPPINTVNTVPATERFATRISWGMPAKEWGVGLQPGERAIHLGHTLRERMREPEMNFPCSPNRHCSPPPRLPPSPRTARVHRSTHPMLRLPPHTTLERQLRTAMFGASPPAGGWDGEKASKYGSFRPKSPQSP